MAAKQAADATVPAPMDVESKSTATIAEVGADPGGPGQPGAVAAGPPDADVERDAKRRSLDEDGQLKLKQQRTEMFADIKSKGDKQLESLGVQSPC